MAKNAEPFFKPAVELDVKLALAKSRSASGE
jgi:hypothetical protein